MSNESDAAAFDGHMLEIERLRQTHAGQQILAAIESAAGQILQAGVSAAQILGPVALEAVKAFAVSTVTAELGKLGGKR